MLGKVIQLVCVEKTRASFGAISFAGQISSFFLKKLDLSDDAKREKEEENDFLNCIISAEKN